MFGVYTVFTNKCMYAFDMCFELIDFSMHVRVIKQNDCGPVAAFPRSHLVFNNTNQVIHFKKITYICSFGISSHLNGFKPWSLYNNDLLQPWTFAAHITGIQNDPLRS